MHFTNEQLSIHKQNKTYYLHGSQLERLSKTPEPTHVLNNSSTI